MDLTVENLSFRYTDEPVLENINFCSSSGNLMGIIGPNGSGKSTLLKCINGLLFPDAGRIFLDDREIKNFSRRDLAAKIGYVPQKESRSFPARVFDIVMMGRRPYVNWKPCCEDKEKAAEIITMLDLEDIAMRDFNRLSGGQQQQVLIARALAQEPDLLLLDEPTSSLDLRHQLEVMEVISDQVENNISALVAMHDLNLAVRFCSEFVMLKGGQIYTQGGKEVINSRSIEEVYEVRAEVKKNEGRIMVNPITSSKNFNEDRAKEKAV